MMPSRRAILLSILILVLGVALPACNLPTIGGAGPRAWIDYPANGMSFTNGTIVVRSHSTGPDAIRQVSLYVDGAEARTDLNSDGSQSLISLSHPWAPPGPGEYTLEVRARDSAGNEGRSLPVRIVIIGCPTPVGGGAAPEECQPIVPPEVVAGITLPPEELAPDAPICTEPTANFTVNANCREGPGVAYPARDTMLEGTSAEIVGKNADGSWFMVRSSSGACWVSAVTLEVCGDLGIVPLIQAAPPPQEEPPPNEPPALSQPAAPSGLDVSQHVCEGTTYAVTLSWGDAADNEDGYRVYRNGGLLASLGPGATSYTDNPPQGGPYTYRVEAFNGAGKAGANTNDPGCLF